MTRTTPAGSATAYVRANWGWLLALGIALAAFFGTWSLLGSLVHQSFYGRTVISDTPVYLDFFDAIRRGGVPYRDLPIPYPPVALPVFVLPGVLGVQTGDLPAYTAVFEGLMLAAGLATIVAVFAALRWAGASRVHFIAALLVLAVWPLLLGPVILSRYDLWPALLTAAGMAAVVAGRHRIGAMTIGLAALAKVYPIVILPVLLVYVWRRQGRAEAVRCLAVVVATFLVVLIPFAVIGPAGLIDTLLRQVSRPLQVESLGAAVAFVIGGLTGSGVTVASGSGSQNLVGPLPDLVALVSSVVQVASLLAVWAWFARGPAERDRFVRAAAAAVVAYVAFGRVLSPQYVIWLAPLVLLVGGRRGLAAGSVLIAAMFLTQAYFPSRYFDLIRETGHGVAAIVLVRDLALVALFAALILPRLWVAATATTAVRRVGPAIRHVRPRYVLLVVLVAAVLLRLLWLTLPQGSLIFDEAYYVNAARAILGWQIPPGASYAGSPMGLDPNSEHPPLGKVAIAASMLIFGDNGLGWRLPSVIAGVVALIAVYGIVRTTGRSRWLGVLTVAILALDNLTFIHGRIGVLDMMAVAAILVGAWLGLRGRPALAGIAFAIGCLVKVTAIFGLLAYLAMEAIPLVGRLRRGETLTMRDLRAPAIAVVATALVGLGGLWLLDLRFTTYTSPFDHVGHMLSYGVSLTGSGTQPSGITSSPWQWLVNGGGFDYLRVNVDLSVNGQVVSTYPTVEFQAALNPVLIGTIWLALPFAIVRAVRMGDRLAQWGLVWIGANYLPFFILVAVTHRITYFYYILPTVPALAALTAVLLLRARLPSFVTLAYLAAMVAGFIVYFPFRQIP